jgi:hypothetical protein
MTSKTILSILSVVLVVLSFSMAAPYALGDRHPRPPPPPSPVIPSACITLLATGWSTTPIITVTMQVSNDEDSGNVGYWALDNYQKQIAVWENPTITTPTFCALVTYTGTWKTFAGALSPQNGVPELRGGSGDMNGGYVATFTATLMPTPTKPVSGFIGAFNLGGTKADILLKTYSAQTGNTATADWLTFYFTSVTGFADFTQPIWAWTYTLETDGRNTKAGYGDMWVNANGGSFGDIVT